jgi:hypothetical protein
VTLLHEMQRRDAKKGLAALCIGGGMGVSLYTPPKVWTWNKASGGRSPTSTARSPARPMTRSCRSASIRSSSIRWRRRTA